MPPENNLIMSGTPTRLFRHLEHQNPSIISGDIGRARACNNSGTEQNGMEQNGTEQRNREVQLS